MQFVSTRGNSPAVAASTAILHGLAPDGGLYIPEAFPVPGTLGISASMPYHEMAVRMLTPFFAGDQLETELEGICREAFSFPVPLHWHNNRQAVLELFHGPTAAFKDFGARFLAGAMEKLTEENGTPLTILVATSGDTGGAVAAAFHGKRSIDVKVLFPYRRVSKRQEKQLTCWGDNVTAYAVKGAFDDCQRMVKTAFMDRELTGKYHLTSANSINLGRLLPQSVYYMYAALQFRERNGHDPVVVIPSGNVGNSVGAYWARAMGAPIKRIILAVNANRTIPDYLESGLYEPRESIATLANAMDVGDPSNMERLIALFGDIERIREQVSAVSVSDGEIRDSIRNVWKSHRYAVCPHTAAGEMVRSSIVPAENSIVVATAHPAKFDTIVEPLIDREIDIPASLQALLEKESACSLIEPEVAALFPK